MTKKIDVLVVKPGRDPQMVQVEDTLDAFKEIVGGSVEAGVILPQRVMLFYDGDQQKDKRSWGEAPISGVTGTILLCGCRGNRFASLTPGQERASRRLLEREMRKEAVPCSESCHGWTV